MELALLVSPDRCSTVGQSVIDDRTEFDCNCCSEGFVPLKGASVISGTAGGSIVRTKELLTISLWIFWVDIDNGQKGRFVVERTIAQ